MKYIIQPDLDFILGDMPNIPMKTMGGHVFWKTKKTKKGYKLQVNYITGHARILDSGDTRVAWGDEETMTDKFDRITREEFLSPGDVIGVSRGLYEHYAVYIGNDKIIHYASESGDFGDVIKVHESTVRKFKGDSETFFVLSFPEKYGMPSKISPIGMVGGAVSLTINEIQKLIKSEKYHLYSPEETIERAMSRLGETSYNLATNNCEHFAIWCKTGISESHQVNMILGTGVAYRRKVKAE